jgi:hypothetical protein
MLGGFSLEGDALTVTTAARSQVTRPLEAGELELLERRLQSPRPLPVHLRSAEGIVDRDGEHVVVRGDQSREALGFLIRAVEIADQHDEVIVVGAAAGGFIGAR